jgi:hypothetical protein
VDLRVTYAPRLPLFPSQAHRHEKTRPTAI